MTFCSNCGAPLLSGASKFCSGCGSSLSNSGQITQSQISQPVEQNYKEPKVIGIIKQLEDDEKVISQSITQTEVIFVKEAHIKKVLGQERK
ncbi:MAG: hypothetical protein ACRD38_07495, partial [Nitrososphaerales archaeon]